MLTLPLPVVVALALAYTAARAWFGGDRARWHPLLVLLVGAAAAQSLLVALVQHYGVTELRWLQPVTASALPPLTWCAFVAVQVRPLRAHDAWHVRVPLVVLLGVLFWPDGLDAADPALLARLDAYMREARPWLNPDRTLVALARKLGVPSKTLSAVVNLGHGENMARYVNRHRIEHACTLLRVGQSVTSVLYDSGFNTKSNFHREFLRIHQMPPTQWLEQAGTPQRHDGCIAPVKTPSSV